MVCLQKTKLKEMAGGVGRSLATGKFVDWAASNAEGASGGIHIFWDSRILQLLEVERSCVTLSCCFRNIEDN